MASISSSTGVPRQIVTAPAARVPVQPAARAPAPSSSFEAAPKPRGAAQPAAPAPSPAIPDEPRKLLDFVHDAINTETQRINDIDVKVSRKGDSTDRSSRILLDALLDPAKAKKILAEGIPSEGIMPPQPRTPAEEQAALQAERELQAAAVARGEPRTPQPVPPSLHQVLTRAAAGEKIGIDELEAMASVVSSWSKGYRVIMDGFYALILDAIKREKRDW